MRGLSTALIVVCALAWMNASASAQKRGGDPEAAAVKNPVAANPASVAAGQKVYAQHCRHCHGVRGLGDGPLAPRNPPPRDLTDGEWEFGSSDGEIFAVIAHGAGPESMMKGVQGVINDRDIWSIVNYLKSLDPAAAKR